MSSKVTNAVVRNSLYDRIMKESDKKEDRKKREFREFVLREQAKKRMCD
jgi:hypothetical protein